MRVLFKVTPLGYRRVLQDVAALWGMLDRTVTTTTMEVRDAIGRSVLLSQECIGVQHRGRRESSTLNCPDNCSDCYQGRHY